MLTLGTAKITHRDGLVIVEYLNQGSFRKGEQMFGASNKGWNAAFRFCRERAFRVVACEC